MGLGAGIAGGIASVVGSLGVDAGVAGAIGSGLVAAGSGAALGAGVGAITGGDIGKDALFGGLSAGVASGLGSAVNSGAFDGLFSSSAGGDVGAGVGTSGAGGLGSSAGFADNTLSLTGGGGTSALGAIGGGTSDLTSGLGSSAGFADNTIGAAGLSSSAGFSDNTVGLSAGIPTTATIQGPTLTGNVSSPTSANVSPVQTAQAIGAQGPGLGSDAGLQDNTVAFSPGQSITNSNTAGQSGGNFFDKALNSVESEVTKNPLGTAVAGGGLLMTLLNGQGAAGKNLSALQSEASGLNAQGQQLASYLQTGQLPPGVKTSIDQATASAKAAVKSNFAARGLSGSTMEQQALQQIDLNAVGQTTSIAEGLLTQGLNEQQIAGSLLQGVLNANVAQQKNTASSITGLAAALSGGTNRTQQAA